MRYEDERRRVVDAPPEDLWRVVEGVGGDRGWGGADPLWALRGRLDRLVGGPGLRRGRRDPDRLRAGDPLDCWRVEQVVPPSLLRLRAEMRLPGTAWLELAVERDERGRTVCVQRLRFVPSGPAGRAYWRAVAPLHGLVLGRQLDGLVRAAERGPD